MLAEITHLPGNSSVTDIIEVVERDGAAIVDDFVSQTFLKEFNSAIQTSIDDYTPYDYGEEEANEFLGYPDRSTKRHRRHGTVLHRPVHGRAFDGCDGLLPETQLRAISPELE